ncbi:LysR family transcriptional regulator [Marinimicrobium koreense]|uniref:LysR family transcriptional regulator n=1 Tax=Marinimicrobium koreense TaxID=306545 RepID=UPI000F4B2B33|nr:LysR family transcriptional regulator [Marinimicrobium koreense]
MDIELLRTFLEVTQTRHFGRAADKLFITPAAVSARIRQLEQTLGVTLFFRTRGNIQMTAEGERLLPHAHHLLEAWADTRRELAREAEPDRHLRLGATPGLWQFLLAGLPARLQRELPDMTLRAEAWSPDELLDRLSAEQLDLALLYDLPGDGALKSRRIGQVRLALFSSQPDLDVKAALADGYVSVDWGAAFALFQAKRFGEVTASLHTNQASVALATFRERKASAYLPEELAGEGVYPVRGAPEFTRPLYAAFRPEQEFSPSVQRVLDVLVEGDALSPSQSS